MKRFAIVWWSIIGILTASWLVTNYIIYHGFAIDFALVDRYSYSSPPVPIECGIVGQGPSIDQQKLKIAFKFRIHEPVASTSDGFQYQNLFQTGPVNTGVRLEFSLATRENVSWGLIFASQQGGVICRDLGRFPSYDDWHTMEIETRSERVLVWLDDILIHDVVLANLAYALYDVVVGSGFSKTRSFNGDIKDFKLRTYRYSPALESFSHIVGILALFGLLVVFFGLQVFVQTRRHSGNYRTASLLTAGIFLYIFSFIYVKSSFVTMSLAAYASNSLFALALLLVVQAIGGLMAKFHRVLHVAFIGLVAGLNYIYFAALCVGGIYIAHKGSTGATATLGFDEVGAIYQSDILEVIGFFSSSFHGDELAIAFLLPLLPTIVIGVMAWGKTMPVPSRNRILIITGLAVISMLTIDMGQSMIGSLTPAIRESRDHVKEFRTFQELRKQKGLVNATKSDRGETYVLVIGEAANRDHFGSYGYSRPTTPWLSSKITGQDWLVFQNAYSNYPHTVPSLLKALTSANQYNKLNDFRSPSIIEVFNAAGFNTYWLSEQGVSWTDNPVNALASESGYVRFVRPIGNVPRALGGILSSLDKSANNLIVIHLMGSHTDYRTRVPPGYKPDFLSKEQDLGNLRKDRADFVRDLLNPYDASIHYTDRTLSEIYDGLQGRIGEVNAMVYVSDHGQDVFGEKFHNASLFTYAMVRIPLIVSVSPAWRARYPERCRVLSDRRESIFTLDLLFDTMLGLADIQTSLRDPKFDLGAVEYGINSDNAVTMWVDNSLQRKLYAPTQPHLIRDDPWIIARRNVASLRQHFGDKFMAVNADGLSTAFEASRLGFPGVENNIAVPAMTIGHYPEVISEFSLEERLSMAPMRRFEKIWLDLRLMNGHKLDESISAFEELDRKYSIKRRSIVESWEPGLRLFSDHGWRTSYLLYKRNWKELQVNNAGDLQGIARAISGIVLAERARAVSFDASHYAFVKMYLEPLLPRDVVYHTWSVDLPSLTDPNMVEKALMNKIVNDRRVETILIESAHIIGIIGGTVP